MHVNAFYDVCNKTYLDCLIQQKTNANEQEALVQMLHRNSFTGNNVVLVDRGYESYNIFATFIETHGVDLVCRVKQNTSALRDIKDLPLSTFDKTIQFELTTTQTNDDKRNNRIFIQTKSKKGKTNSPKTVLRRWDYSSPYKMKLRICRFMINNLPDQNGSIEQNPANYETIVTTLDKCAFSLQEIKELYHMRWGIETSFRDLKYNMGMVNLHSKDENSICQEIFARFIMYNLCGRITAGVVDMPSRNRKHIYQVNFTQAIWFCKQFCHGKINADLLISKINQYIEPIRPGRSDKRKLRPTSFVSFLYRVAA